MEKWSSMLAYEKIQMDVSYLINKHIYNVLLCRVKLIYWVHCAGSYWGQWNITAEQTVQLSGQIIHQPHYQLISAQHYRRCWPINLNAKLKLVSLSSQNHPHSRNKCYSLFLYISGFFSDISINSA